MAHPTKLAAWRELAALAATTGRKPMREMFAADPGRFGRFSTRLGDLLLDYSKNRIDGDTMGLLTALAAQAGVAQARDAMFAGDKINATEHRSVLHVALRNRSGRPMRVDGADVMPQVTEVLAKMQDFSHRVRSGEWTGATGKPMTSVVNIN